MPSLKWRRASAVACGLGAGALGLALGAAGALPLGFGADALLLGPGAGALLLGPAAGVLPLGLGAGALPLGLGASGSAAGAARAVRCQGPTRHTSKRSRRARKRISFRYHVSRGPRMAKSLEPIPVGLVVGSRSLASVGHLAARRARPSPARPPRAERRADSTSASVSAASSGGLLG